jgi:hypothetical protein
LSQIMVEVLKSESVSEWKGLNRGMRDDIGREEESNDLRLCFHFS